MAATPARGFDARGGPEAMLFAGAGSGRAATIATLVDGTPASSPAELAEPSVEDASSAAVQASLERIAGSR
jgi:hypothetical protein